MVVLDEPLDVEKRPANLATIDADHSRDTVACPDPSRFAFHRASSAPGLRTGMMADFAEDFFTASLLLRG